MRNNIRLKGLSNMEYLLVFSVTTLLFLPLKYRYLTYRDRIFAFLFFALPCFVILVLFIGLRNDVGIDYRLYYNMYYFNWGQEKELGYRFINEIFRNLNLPFQGLLVFVAALSLYFVFILIKNIRKIYLSSGNCLTQIRLM